MSFQDPQMSGADYNQEKRQPIITSATYAPSRAPQFAGGMPDPTSVSVQILQTDEIARNYRNMSEVQRKATAQLLKDAGFPVPVTGKYNIRVRDALLEAYGEFDTEVKSLAETDPDFFKAGDYDLTKYLRDRTLSGGDAGGPQTIRYRQDPTDAALESSIDEVYRELLGRGASKEEARRFSKKIRNKLSQVENMASSTIVDLGGGVQQRTDRPGFDTQSFLYEQLGGTDEAKTRTVFSFYDTFKKALGV